MRERNCRACGEEYPGGYKANGHCSDCQEYSQPEAQRPDTFERGPIYGGAGPTESRRSLLRDEWARQKQRGET